tara:strand:- start:139 stop:309 length:171 start_codon:yes stop_codon:yes gene_type:complete
MTNAPVKLAEPQGPVGDEPKTAAHARGINGPGDLYLALQRLKRGDGIKRQWYKKMY